MEVITNVDSLGAKWKCVIDKTSNPDGSSNFYRVFGTTHVPIKLWTPEEIKRQEAIKIAINTDDTLIQRMIKGNDLKSEKFFTYGFYSNPLQTKKTDYDTIAVASGGGTHSDTVLLLLGTIYDLILPVEKKKNIYLHNTHIWSPFYDIQTKAGARGANHGIRTDRFHESINYFLDTCWNARKKSPEIKHCYSIMTLRAFVDGKHKGHSTLLEGTIISETEIQLMHYDSNGFNAKYSKYAKPDDTIYAYLKRNASTLSANTSWVTVTVKNAVTTKRQTSKASCGLWSTFICIARMFDVNIPTSEAIMQPISNAYRQFMLLLFPIKKFNFDKLKVEDVNTVFPPNSNDQQLIEHIMNFMPCRTLTNYELEILYPPELKIENATNEYVKESLKPSATENNARSEFAKNFIINLLYKFPYFKVSIIGYNIFLLHYLPSYHNNTCITWDGATKGETPKKCSESFADYIDTLRIPVVSFEPIETLLFKYYEKVEGPNDTATVPPEEEHEVFVRQSFNSILESPDFPKVLLLALDNPESKDIFSAKDSSFYFSVKAVANITESENSGDTNYYITVKKGQTAKELSNGNASIYKIDLTMYGVWELIENTFLFSEKGSDNSILDRIEAKYRDERVDELKSLLLHYTFLDDIATHARARMHARTLTHVNSSESHTIEWEWKYVEEEPQSSGGAPPTAPLSIQYYCLAKYKFIWEDDEPGVVDSETYKLKINLWQSTEKSAIDVAKEQLKDSPEIRVINGVNNYEFTMLKKQKNVQSNVKNNNEKCSLDTIQLEYALAVDDDDDEDVDDYEI